LWRKPRNISGSTRDQDLSSFAINTNLALKVDKVAGKGLSMRLVLEKAKLVLQSQEHTGDQDLSSFATNLALKWIKKVKVYRQRIIQQEKAKLAAISGTIHQDLSSLLLTQIWLESG
jgi:hypothetical protein